MYDNIYSSGFLLYVVLIPTTAKHYVALKKKLESNVKSLGSHWKFTYYCKTI